MNEKDELMNIVIGLTDEECGLLINAFRCGGLLHEQLHECLQRSETKPYRNPCNADEHSPV